MLINLNDILYDLKGKLSSKDTEIIPSQQTYHKMVTFMQDFVENQDTNCIHDQKYREHGLLDYSN